METTKTKSKKRKALQITYPAPYSQSWNPDVAPVLMKTSVGRANSVAPVQAPPAKPRRKQQTQQVIKLPVEQYNKQLLIPPKKKPARKAAKFPPVFVFRNVDKSYSKNLSYSKITHMDIKPRRIASLSPSYCPSPNFKALPRRFSVSPTKLLFIKNEGKE